MGSDSAPEAQSSWMWRWGSTAASVSSWLARPVRGPVHRPALDPGPRGCGEACDGGPGCRRFCLTRAACAAGGSRLAAQSRCERS